MGLIKQAIHDLFLGEEKRGDGGVLNSPAVSLNSPAIWAWLSGGSSTESGEVISEMSALQFSTVFSCIRVISESIASLPLKLYERLDNKGRMEAADQPLYEMLAYEPNPEMTAFTFWESIIGSLALTGNGYAQIVRNGAGQPSELWPLHPLKCEPIRLPSGKLAYRTTDGEQLGNYRVVPSDDMLHLLLFGFDGLKGLSPIAMCRQTFGVAKAAEKYAAKFYGNSAQPSGVLLNANKLQPEQLAQARDSWNSMQGGVNQNRTAVLTGGWTWQQLAMSAEDAQFLQTRGFARAEIASIFRLNPHMVGDTSRLSGNNAEQANLQFVSECLRPYLCKVEQECRRKLLPGMGRNANKYFVQFDVTELLRMDRKSQNESFALGRQWGWLSANDVLREIGENPIGPVGDIYMQPVNMANAENFIPGNEPPPPAAMPVQIQEPAEPGQKDEAPADKERSLLAQYSTAFIALARDAVGRTIKRDKRDFEVISSTFTPLLVGILDQITDVTRAKFGLPDTWVSDTNKLVREHVKGIESRAGNWTADKSEEITGQELTKAVRSFFITVNKDAAAQSAIKQLEH